MTSTLRSIPVVLEFCCISIALHAQSASTTAGMIVLSPDRASPPKDTGAGTQMCFTLTAKDQGGNTILDWNMTGQNVTIKMMNSTANTDSNARSWNVKQNAYSFSTMTIPNTSLPQPVMTNFDVWEINKAAFMQGQASLCFTDTKAEGSIYFEVSPRTDSTTQSSMRMNFKHGPVDNFLAEITSQTANPDQVFVVRPYELIVTPRDQFLNPIEDVDVITNFTARYPGEFDPSYFPGTDNIFSGDFNLKTKRRFILVSVMERKRPDQLQNILPSLRDNFIIRGRTNNYEIFNHAPTPFHLLTPAFGSVVRFSPGAATFQFLRERPDPPDPYTDIRISRLDTILYSDVVRYQVLFVDSATLTHKAEFRSDGNGSLLMLTLTHDQLSLIIDSTTAFSGKTTSRVIWLVQASDGIYTTINLMEAIKPGDSVKYNFVLEKKQQVGVNDEAVARTFTLEQNSPNPFSRSTSISYRLMERGHVRLQVFDALGREVATLVYEVKEAGGHEVTFSRKGLNPGVYFYRLITQHGVRTKFFIVLK